MYYYRILGIEMKYDRILKFNEDSKDCHSCMGNTNCDDWVRGCLGEKYYISDPDLYCVNDSKFYAHEEQLPSLIKEAESGKHQWVLVNGTFICKIKDCPKEKVCRYKKPQASKNTTCSYSGVDGWIMKPYRGIKGEKQTWPGKTGATHLEALKELIERGIITGGSDKDCSEVKFLCNDDGKSCSSCACESDYLACLGCGNEYKNYERKQDRSDTNYTHNKEALKKAGEDALKKDMKEKLQSKLERFSEPLKKESEDKGKEYVVIKHISLETLNLSNHISDNMFREIFKYGEVEREAGSVLKDKDFLLLYPHSLVAGGFIEEKNSDPVVEQGDTFKYRHCKYKIVQVSPRLYQLIDIEGGNRYSNIIVDANNGPMHLSDFLPIKFKLKEFETCKVKIEVVG